MTSHGCDGLGGVGMMAKDDRPFILQKAGGLQGIFTYIAFAPTRNAAVFIAINELDFGAAFTMASSPTSCSRRSPRGNCALAA